MGYTRTSGSKPQIHGAGEHTDRTRKVFVPVMPYSGGQQAIGLWHGEVQANNDTSSTKAEAFHVPADFVSLVHIHAVVVPLASGNLYWQIQTAISANGEAHDNETEVSGYQTTAVTANAVTELPDQSLCANLAVGDFLGVVINRDSTHANDTVENGVVCLGYLFEYVADQ